MTEPLARLVGRCDPLVAQGLWADVAGSNLEFHSLLYFRNVGTGVAMVAALVAALLALPKWGITKELSVACGLVSILTLIVVSAPFRFFTFGTMLADYLAVATIALLAFATWRVTRGDIP